jgi:hypothetical protein
MAVIEVASDEGLTSMLESFDAIGGALDYVALRASAEVASLTSHRAAVLVGIAEIDRRLGKAAEARASVAIPAERFFRLTWDESKLSGEPVSFPTFWGTDDVRPRSIGGNGWSIPNVDGYKIAFFHPPYKLLCFDEAEELFDRINAIVLGLDPAACEIFSWSTDWSNYFDAGREWWGAFYWTVRPARSDRFYVIGASSTD